MVCNRTKSIMGPEASGPDVRVCLVGHDWYAHVRFQRAPNIPDVNKPVSRHHPVEFSQKIGASCCKGLGTLSHLLPNASERFHWNLSWCFFCPGRWCLNWFLGWELCRCMSFGDSVPEGPPACRWDPLRIRLARQGKDEKNRSKNAWNFARFQLFNEN